MSKTATSFVTVKTKYQVTIPASLRRQIKLSVGDVLEVSALAYLHRAAKAKRRRRIAKKF